MKIELTWGESVALRNNFVSLIPSFRMPFITKHTLLDMNYSPFEGNPELVEITRKVIKRQIGQDYKYVFLTNGATGGVSIALRAYRSIGKISCVTFEPPYFRLYPKIVASSGLKHVNHKAYKLDEVASPVFLVDSPSNPRGIFREAGTTTDYPVPVIWDTVYYTGSYARVLIPIKHDILVGSYSKMTGLNGIRIGWIALNDDKMADIIREMVAAEYCGLSVPSMDILARVLPDYPWDQFEEDSRRSLDANREEFAKLERYFSGSTVPDVGMFFYGLMDKEAKDLFFKADVVWTPGSSLGHNDDWGRFNIGRDYETTKKAVTQVLKADGI